MKFIQRYSYAHTFTSTKMKSGKNKIVSKIRYMPMRNLLSSQPASTPEGNDAALLFIVFNV